MESRGGRIFSIAWQLLFSVIMVILFCGQLWALEPGRQVDQYLVDSWQISEGISSDEIRSIAQTPDGYLWIATSKNLVRFDGLSFSIINFINEGDLVLQKNTVPDVLLVDKEGTLWIGSSAGLTSYQHQTGQFKTFTFADGITKDNIRRIREDLKGNLWISFHSSYLDHFSNGDFTNFNNSHGLGGNKINDIVERKNGDLLFATRENGIFTYKAGRFFKYPVAGLENAQIVTIHEDGKGYLWIGSNKGLFYIFGGDTWRFTSRDGLSNDYITFITEDSDRNLWIGTAKGLNRIIKKGDGTTGFEYLLKENTIYCLFEDKEKSLWVGTYTSGIKRLKDSKFFSYEPLRELGEEILFSLFENKHGEIWIGALDGKLFRCRGSKLIESLEPAEVSGAGITAIAEDVEGSLWLGTIGKGVFQKKNRTFLQFTNREGLSDNLVTSISRDRQGNLWFSTFDGVSVFRFYTGLIESFKSKNGLLGKKVHNVYEDKTGNIWIAADKGVTVLKEGRTTKESIVYYLKDVPVTYIYQDPDVSPGASSVYWLATHGEGLKRLKDGAVTSYTTGQGMASNFLYRFFEDDLDNFWLMSDSGILRVNKDELARYADGKADTVNCTSFGISDGMKSLEFNNKFSRHSALKTRHGEFLFITKKGITRMNPGKIQINKFPPPVVIEAVFFNRESIPLHLDVETNTFKGINDFRFNFTAPTFLSPGKVKFKYQLEGVDREWVTLPLGSLREVFYKGLYPGTYTFRVIACNSDGVWNRTGDSFTFTLKPLFYQTALFKIAIILFIFIAIVAVVFILFKKKKQPLKKQLAEDKAIEVKPVNEQAGKEESIEKKPVEEQKKYKGTSMNPRFVEECLTKLKYLMEIEKIYRDETISLRSLAKKSSIPYFQLSRILNEKLGQNFSDYINYYRIEDAKKILIDPKKKNRKIDVIASEVGYNTRPAFNRAFKKYTNMTPTQYRQDIENKN